MASSPPEPLLRFVIGGVQKAGTTALARYLGAHPSLQLPRDKEAHVFDAPDFDAAASPSQIDARYAPLFDAASDDTLHGDATPFYLAHADVIARIARYNPAMRWIVLLRDPVERAISQHHMERERQKERWPLPLALLLERGRLRRDAGNLARGSSLRRHSYLARSDYASQLDALYAYFPREQVLLLRNDELRATPALVVARACEFLGVPGPSADATYPPVFTGDYPRIPRGSVRWRLLRWWFRRELHAMRERYEIRFD